jgi:hypothetical protein
VLGGKDGAAVAAILGADAALDVGEIGLTADDVASLGSGMELDNALLLLVIENVWIAGLRDALRDAGLVYAEQDYLTPEGLVALGAMFATEIALGRSRHPAQRNRRITKQGENVRWLVLCPPTFGVSMSSQGR